MEPDPFDIEISIADDTWLIYVLIDLPEYVAKNDRQVNYQFKLAIEKTELEWASTTSRFVS